MKVLGDDLPSVFASDRLLMMDRQSEAPQQHKQPSRKGRGAWRKNVDISDLQAGLRQVQEEQIKGSEPKRHPHVSSP